MKRLLPAVPVLVCSWFACLLTLSLLHRNPTWEWFDLAIPISFVWAAFLGLGGSVAGLVMED